jgi:type IV secretory pathway component VirB8
MTLVAVASLFYGAVRPPSVIRHPHVVFINPVDGTHTNLEELRDTTFLWENEMVNKGALIQFVLCREGWTMAMYNHQWQRCSSYLVDSPAHAATWALYDEKNPKGFFMRYGREGSVEVSRIRITPYKLESGKVEPGKYEVHFMLTETIGGSTLPPSKWVSHVKIEFNRKYFDELYNQLGMRVLSYTRQPESIE